MLYKSTMKAVILNLRVKKGIVTTSVQKGTHMDENGIPIAVYIIDAEEGEVVYNIFDDEEKQDIVVKIKETVI